MLVLIVKGGDAYFHVGGKGEKGAADRAPIAKKLVERFFEAEAAKKADNEGGDRR